KYAVRNWEGAMEPLLGASTDDPGSARALVAFGRLETAIGGQEAVKAKGFFGKAIAIDPDYADAYIEQSHLELAGNDAAGARASGEKAIGADPTRPEAYEAAAAAAVAGKDPVTAEKWLQIATQIDPEDFETWMDLGEARRLSGNPQGALEPLQKAAALKKDIAEPQIRLGNAWEDLGDLKKAGDAYAEAAKIEPDNVKVAVRAGVVKAKNGEYTDARKMLEAVVAQHSEIAEAHFWLGVSYQQTQEPDRALDAYRQSIKHGYPDAFMADYHSAELLAAPGPVLDKDAAKEMLHAALQLKPDLWQAHELAADIALTNNELDDAVKELKAVDDSTQKLPAAARTPILVRIRLKQGKILRQQTHTREAEKVFNEVLKIDPKSADALFNLGDLYRDTDNRKAKVYYQKAIVANKSYAPPWKALGYMAKDDNNDCEAKRDWQKFVELAPNPNSDEVKEVRDDLSSSQCDR
ncbi:MAG: tetratricopeptide repeat protein, partial [Stellaceae bacterium]